MTRDLRWWLLTLAMALAACSDPVAATDAAPDTIADVADTGADGSGDAGDANDTGDTGDASEVVSATLAPAEGPQSGYFEVVATLDGLAPEEVTGVRTGAVAAVQLEVVGADQLRFLVQGAPEPGPVDVTFETAEGSRVAADAFTWLAPSHPAFARIAAFGASLTQGVQQGTPSFHGGLMSPPAQLARQLGGYMPLPLLVPGLFPQMQPSDIGPPPECAPPDNVDFITEAVADVVPQLQDPETGDIEFGRGLLDPGLEVFNVAVGNSKLDDVLYGPDDVAERILTRLVYEPDGGILDPAERTELDVLDAIEPTLIVSADLLGNNLLGSVTGDKLNPGKILPVEEIRDDLDAIVDRVAATGAEVFIADMPRPTLLPFAAEKRASQIAEAVEAAVDAGEDPEAAADAATVEADAALAEIDALAAAYNDALAESADRYDNVHIVGFEARVEAVAAEPMIVDGQSLSTKKFGGMLSLDGVHFTDTGYAVLVNEFVATINAVLGTDVPAIDLAPILAQDVGSPEALTAAGISRAACGVQ